MNTMPNPDLLGTVQTATAQSEKSSFVVPVALEMGLDDGGNPLMMNIVKLLEGRLLVQGVSGAGKSWTLRRVLEQSSKILPQIIIDPEGEFGSLADEFGYLHVAAERLDEYGFAMLAERIRAHRASVVLDLSEVGREQQMQCFIAFITALINVPREHWSPVIVAVDEAQLFAPLGGHTEGDPAVRKASVAAMADLMGRGRKRGLVGVLATQRLARLSKSVVSEITNFLIGLNTQDLDLKRAATNLGWDAKRAAELRELVSGRFVAAGPAFGPNSRVITVGPVRSKHLGATPTLAPPCEMTPAELRKAVGLDDLIAAAAGQGHLAASDSYQTRLANFLKHPQAQNAAMIYAALSEPGAESEPIGRMGKVLRIEKKDMIAAADLLERQGLIESEGNGRRRRLACVQMFDDAGDNDAGEDAEEMVSQREQIEPVQNGVIDDMEVARQRYAILEPYLSGRSSMREISDATGKPIATLNAWKLTYKRRGKISDLMPRRKGRVMPTRIQPEVEQVIEATIRSFTETGRRLVGAQIASAVNQRCGEAGLASPSYATVLARLQVEKKGNHPPGGREQDAGPRRAGK
jgi:hypothetical protein